MSESSGPNVDLQLLRCFDALVSCNSVTLAADRLNMSQPGMSNALARLRKIFGDPILQRTARGMTPTDFALKRHAEVKENLVRLSALLQPQEFVPAQSRDQVRVAASDAAIGTALSPILRELREQAPQLQIQVLQLSHVRVHEPLEMGAADLALGFYQDLQPTLYARPVARTQAVCIVGQNSTRCGPLTLQDYASAPHATFNMTPEHRSTFEALIDQLLAQRGLRRQVTLSTPTVSILAAMVEKSDLLATVPAIVAHWLQQRHHVRVMDCPLPLPEIEFSLVWHARSAHRPAVAWLRDKLVQSMERSMSQARLKPT